MEDTVKSDVLVGEIAEFIDAHKGVDTIALDISSQSSFTDFFIITTVTSWAHLKGLFRELKIYLKEREVFPLSQQKVLRDETWVFIDCGSIVIHLMNRETREFYELEKLWFSGRIVYQSSKSSKSSPSS
jgi:ribosome-associated protein